MNEMGNPTPVPTSPFVGIVDPFLSGPVHPGQFFWLVIYPRQITSLRHVWSHPAFPEEAQIIHHDEDEPPAAMFHHKQYGDVTEAQLIALAKPGKTRAEEAEQLIRDTAESYGLSYLKLLSAAKDYLETGDYIHGGEDYEGAYVGDDFWDAYELVTGQKVAGGERGSFFSCSC